MSGLPASAAPAEPVSPDEWRQVMALLDTALDLEPAARARWLDSLGPEHAALLPNLRALLSGQSLVEASGFMQSSPADALGGSLATAQPAPQSLVGPYRLLREIGQGGMASVWLAERADGLLERRVALKLPHASWGSGSFALRMARERSILASLTHPNIARLYDVGTAADGRPFLAMEYVDGQPIDVHCKAHALGLRERVVLVVQVARAVAHAHAQLVVHRDLKPSNILVDAQGQVHLLDFGIARLVDPPLADGGGSGVGGGSAGDATVTQAHGRALTPDYASPEQIRGDAIGTGSDIYSLGVVLFELLVGERPYRLPRGAGPAALAEAVAALALPRPSAAAAEPALRRQLKGDLDAIVARALRQASRERYATMAALADDLERHLRGEPVQAGPDALWYRADRWVRRHKLETAVAAAIVVAVPAGAAAQAAVLVAIGAGAAVALWQMRVARQQAQLARQQTARAEQVKDFTLSILQAANTDAGAGAATSAVDVLKAAHARIAHDLAGRPEIAVELMVSVGEGLHGLGEVHDAARILGEAVALAQGELGPHHPHTPAAMVAYGSALVGLDRRQEAIPLLVPAIAEARRQNLAHALIEGLRWLSACRLMEGDFDDGARQAQAAVDVIVAAGPAARRLDAVNAWHALANALSYARRSGVVDAAGRALAMALELAHGRPTEAVINSRLLLAKGFGIEGRDAEALAQLDAAWAEMVQLFGPAEHRWTEVIANTRGQVRLNAGDVAGAIEDFRTQLAAGLSRSGGETGRHVGVAYRALGKALAAARRDDEALDFCEKGERLIRAATSDGNLHVLSSTSERALLLARLGRFDEAEPCVAALAEAHWRGAEAERAEHLGRLACLRSLQGRHDEAMALARQSAQGLHTHPDKSVRAIASSRLGHALLAAGQAAEAVGPLREAARLFAEKELMVSPDQADAVAALARAEAEAHAPSATR